MTTYNTGNPIGSVSPKDLYDNSENLDHAVNGAPFGWRDRFGRDRLSWSGIEERARLDTEAAAAEAAAVATAKAGEYRDEANRAAVDAKEARDDAIAAASASGDFVFAETYSEAASKLPLPEGTIVEVGRDESQDDARTRYIVENGSLHFAVNLDLLRIALAEPDGSKLIGFRRDEVGAAARTQQSKNEDILSVRDYITTPVDGTTSNQEGIEAAVAAAEASGADLDWPATDGDYVSTGNIPGFHRVRHTGCGVIRRGLNRWHITPREDTDVNTVFIANESNQGDENNDGLSADFPRRYVDIPATVLSFAGKESAGTWRFQFAPGVIQTTGIRSINWPVFKNRLEFIGATVPWNTSPTSIIDGSISTEAYAFRAENSSSLLNLLFRNLLVRKFDNGTANSGGIILWNDCRVLTENLWIDDCPFGISARYGYLRVLGGKVSNCRTLGIAVTYTATGNIGSLSTARDEGVTIENCNHGVDIGRLGICYIQKNTFIDNNYNIYATRYSRFRNQANRHVSWKRAAIYSAWSLHTPANGVQPDTYEQTPTAAAPMYEHFRAEHLDMHVGPKTSRHHMSDGDLINIDGVSGQPQLLASHNGTWVPFRLPGGTLYANNWRMKLEFMVVLSNGAAGEIALYGAGSSESARIAFINIAPVDGAKIAKVTFDLYPSTATAGASRYRIEIVGQGINLEARGTSSLGYSSIRSPDELPKLFRLYWTPSSNSSVTFYSLFTYIEA